MGRRSRKARRRRKKNNPAPPANNQPLSDLPCERCGAITPNMQFFRKDYWLCQNCVQFHIGIAIKARLMREFNALNPPSRAKKPERKPVTKQLLLELGLKNAAKHCKS